MIEINKILMGKPQLKYSSLDLLVSWLFAGLMKILLCVQIWKI